MTITVKKIRPYVKALLLVAFAAMCVYFFILLGYYFYPTLTGSQTVSALQKNIAGQIVNVKEFDSLADNISHRASSSLKIIPPDDPFK